MKKNRTAILILPLLFSGLLLAFQPSSSLSTSDPESGPDLPTLSMKSALNYYYFWSDKEDLYLYVQVKAAKAKPGRDRIMQNLALVLDRSGSMAGEKLNRVKEAVGFVIDTLERNDRFGLVTYETGVSVVHPSAPLVDKASLHKKVEAIQSGGSTFLSGGLEEGYKQAKFRSPEPVVNRVLLLSDGLANKGVVSPSALNKIVKDKVRSEGTTVSTFGVGADYNEDLMTQMAENGGGNYYFIETPEEIGTIFRQEMKDLNSVIAQETELKIGYDNLHLKVEDVYGYPWYDEKDHILIPFHDVVSERELRVLIRFSYRKDVQEEIEFPLTMKYVDCIHDRKEKQVKQKLMLKPLSGRVMHDQSYDENVAYQVAYFEANASLEKAQQLVDSRNFNSARSRLSEALELMEKRLYHIEVDSTLEKQYNDLVVYRSKLKDLEKMDPVRVQYYQKASKSRQYQRKTLRIR